MFQMERWLMLPASMNPAAKLSFEALRLGCEAYSLIGLRLFKMTTGGVPAVSEALRMMPEKLTALIDAQILTGQRPIRPPRLGSRQGRCPVS
jgi:hypothetical protein